MQKDTAEIVKQLQLSPDFQTFYRENKEYMVQALMCELSILVIMCVMFGGLPLVDIR